MLCVSNINELNISKLNYDNLTVSIDANMYSYIVNREDNNVSIYTGLVKPTTFGFTKNESNLYYSLASSLDNSTNDDIYRLLNDELTQEQFVSAIKSMTPSMTSTSISSINNINSSISTIKDHLTLKTKNEVFSTNLWIQGYGVNSQQDDMGDKDGYTLSGNGVIVGGDKKLDSANIIYGAALSYSTTNISSTSNHEIKSTQQQLYLYLAQKTKDTYLQAYLSKGIGQNNGNRSILLGDKILNATSSYNNQLSNVTLSYGLKYKYNNIRITPYATLSSSIVSTDVYTEKGAENLNLEVSNKDLLKTSTTLGANFATKFRYTSNHIFLPELKLSYRKDFGDKYAKATAIFQDSDYTFETNGIKMDDKMYSYGLSMKYFNKEAFFIARFDFDSIRSKRFSSNIASFSLRYLFE